MRISDWSSAVCSSDLGTFLLDGARRYVPAYAGLAVGQRTQHRAFIAGLGTIRARVRSADLRTDPSTREDRPAQRRAKLKTQAVARVQIAQRARLQAATADQREARKTFGGCPNDLGGRGGAVAFGLPEVRAKRG